MEKSSTSWWTAPSHSHNRTCTGVFICHLLQYCGINCRCRWIKCFSTNHRSAGLANRTSPHAISRARTVITVHVVVFHVPFIAALWHQLPLDGDQMPPYKPESCMNCELHLATRHLSRNTEGRPCDPQGGHTGGTTPALQPQENCVHNTSVTFKASARAQPPSSLILFVVRSRYSSDVFVW